MRGVADQTSDRPIGEPHDVAGAVLAGGAERAGCAASHGHEVSAIVVPELARPASSATAAALNHDAIEALATPLCDAAFPGYVGRALEGSRYLTFPVVPDTDAAAEWVAQGRRIVCLVARADGQWMDHAARSSVE